MEGELPAAELDLADVDELIHLSQPLSYELEVEKFERGILVQGRLRLPVECECARCLEPYQHLVVMESWACHLALEGEEKIAIINDCVDLTPYIREDILLSFPQQPLCGPECKGLTALRNEQDKPSAVAQEPESASTAWAELNKLKF